MFCQQLLFYIFLFVFLPPNFLWWRYAVVRLNKSYCMIAPFVLMRNYAS